MGVNSLRKTSGVLGGICGYTAYTNLRVFLTAYTHLNNNNNNDRLTAFDPGQPG